MKQKNEIFNINNYITIIYIQTYHLINLYKFV